MCRTAGRRGNLDVSIESPSSDQFRQPVMKSAQESETFKSSWTQSWLTEKFKEEAKILHNTPFKLPLPPEALILTLLTESGASR